ncbi:ABC transporter substrate-binding protein [Campylobacter sp. MIT 99-7217]|uniref:ABC transporter substrate-binding protein n=1 Tax=Campylobacter sp. MIT 99-7217 TaxID=535091 RepID=UPI00115C2851|nr:ABC transporter substrate-binding protein [Campylobacter sp. MIT 99-7217]TQR32429.1 ABC transporter substrate-binding protein [Campylobacter sp. MIT 99-7217]
MKKIVIFFCLAFTLLWAKQERLVVLDPASIEIIYMLGAEESIKGIATLQQSNIYPEEKTKTLESVGTFSNPSIEKIVALKPSLVILSSYSLKIEQNLKQLGLKTIYLEAKRFDDMYKNIQTLAKLLDKQKEGEALIAKTKEELKGLSQNPINKSGIFLFSSNPLMAFSSNSLIADILQIIGIKNLTPQSQIQRPIISSEYILTQNPDMLILGIQATDIDELTRRNPLLKSTKAYKNKRIYVYPKTHTLLRLSPNIIDQIKNLKTALEK